MYKQFKLDSKLYLIHANIEVSVIFDLCPLELIKIIIDLIVKHSVNHGNMNNLCF